MEKISFQTSDGVLIKGNYWKGGLERCIILIHMMPATKESWNEFAEKLNHEIDFSVLAIDLRGHGESLAYADGREKTLQYKDFSEKEHQDSKKDVVASRNWLREKGFDPKNIVVGGASIGANLSLWYASEFTEDCRGAIALSPGLDYMGLKADEFASKLSSKQEVFLVFAEDDKVYAGECKKHSEGIYNALGSRKDKKVYEKGKHGTMLFTEHPELMDELKLWLADMITLPEL